RNRARFAASAARFFSSSSAIAPTSQHPRLRKESRVSLRNPHPRYLLDARMVPQERCQVSPQFPRRGGVSKFFRCEAPRLSQLAILPRQCIPQTDHFRRLPAAAKQTLNRLPIIMVKQETDTIVPRAKIDA